MWKEYATIVSSDFRTKMQSHANWRSVMRHIGVSWRSSCFALSLPLNCTAGCWWPHANSEQGVMTKVGPASKPVAETAQLARACKAVAFFFYSKQHYIKLAARCCKNLD
jgi:hypothetical protein